MWYNNGMNKMIVFDSGLRLVVYENPAVRSIATGVFVGAGSAYENPELSGISHFIEHMVFKGTENRSAFDIAHEIDSVGAQINAYTSKTGTCFYTVSQDVRAEKCLDVLSDMYFNPLFSREDMDKERKVVLEELSESEDSPDDLCLERLSSAFFRGHPLENTILGTKKTLKAMTPADLHAYKNAFYVPSNTVVSMVGHIEVAHAEELVCRYFEDRMKSGVSNPRTPLAVAPMKGHFVHRKKDIEQAHMAFAFPGVAYDTDENFAVRLLAAVFGMEMSSRLFQNVREKLGLCYSIVGYPSSYENNGSFIIYTSTNPQNVELAVGAIRKEIEKLVDDGITDAELNMGKEQIKTAMVLGQESTSAVMRCVGKHALMTDKLYDVDEQIARVDALTKEDVEAVARKIFDFDRVTASFVGGEIKDIQKMMKSRLSE